MPPAKIPIRDAAEIVGLRERARWRRIAGEPIELFEGPRLGWTVVVEPAQAFKVSPGFRTVYVSGVRDESELRACLGTAAGRIEAIAVAGGDAANLGIPEILDALGVSYIPEPGEMQSPPLLWRHGGGAFLDMMAASQ